MTPPLLPSGFLELDFFRNLLPLAFVGHLDGAAGTLLQNEDAVALFDERSAEIFASKVVDEADVCLVWADYLAVGDDPDEVVVDLTQVSWQFSEKVVGRDNDVFLVEIDVQVDAIFFVGEVAFEVCAVILCANTQ